MSSKDIKTNKIDNEIEVTTKEENIRLDNKGEKFKHVDFSQYNWTSQQHIPKRYVDNDSYFNTISSDEELKNLAIDPQNNINKIKRINQIAKYYINSDDIVGKIHETIENNINPKVKLNFSSINGRNKQKTKTQAEDLINAFNDSINVKKLLRKGIPLAYDEGNYFMYLRNIGDNYKVDTYPLGIYEISDYILDDENIAVINVSELSGRLTNTGLSNANGKVLFNKTVLQEIKENYPNEVYDAYTNKKIYAILDITRTGNVTINDLNGRYGLTPLFKAFKPLKASEIYDRTNISNAKTKAKKILMQKLSDKMLGTDGQAEFDTEKWEFAHNNFISSYKASQNSELVFVTLPPWADSISYVEPKVQDIDITIVNQQRNRVLSALGISFLSNESKSSFNTVEISVNELMKTIDKISEGFADVLTKWYSLLLKNNKIPLTYLPEVEIESSSLLEMELKLKIADILYSKMGASYRTTFETLGYNFDEEVRRREEENKYNKNEGLDTVFSPHPSSYTSNSNDLLDDKNGKNTEVINDDKEQKEKNANDYKNKQ